MKTLKTLCSILIITAFIAGTVAVYAAEQTTCPVTGMKINKEYYTDYKGERIYFCTADCIKAFHAHPAKYMKKLQKKGVTLEPTPKK